MAYYPKPSYVFQPPPAVRMFLTDDETITASAGAAKGDSEFRVRVWRAEGRPSLVLVSQLPNQPCPNWATCKLARKAWEAYLGFGPMDYCEAFAHNGENRMVRYQFEGCGHAHRCHFRNSFGRTITWEEVREMTGEQVSM